MGRDERRVGRERRGWEGKEGSEGNEWEEGKEEDPVCILSLIHI